MHYKTISLLLLVLLLVSPTLAQRPAAPTTGVQIWVTGDSSDSVVDLSNAGPALLLMGGSVEVDEAFRDQAFPLIPNGDIVVLRASGSDGYNDYLFEELTTGPNQPNSVETIRFDDASQSNSAYVKWVIDTAELIWFAGGDQSEYLNHWMGTEVQAAVQRAYDRGAIIGGTSAGLAIMGEKIYDPDNVGSLTSTQALVNVQHPNLMISDGMFDIDFMKGIITDTHFEERDRIGRSLAFLLNEKDGLSEPTMILAINERTSLFIDRNGLGTVKGRSAVYLMGKGPNTTFGSDGAGQPLVIDELYRYRVPVNGTIDFSSRRASVLPMTLSVDGTETEPYTPTDPYAIVGPSSIEGHVWGIY